MSEYQFYDFLAIDKPLSNEAQQYIKTLSSRVKLTASSASFEYNFGDFRGKPYQLVRDYFDAMLYMANWGSRQVMLRFPAAAISLELQEAYEFGEYITWTKEGDFYILDIQYHPEETEFYGWLEGAGILAGIAAIREEILRGDYRALYLAWLKVAEYESYMPDYDYDYYEDEEEKSDEDLAKAKRLIEPPVPAGLNHLSPALNNFAEFFLIDEDMMHAAAEASTKKTDSQLDYRPLLEQLADEEKFAFLERLLKGERFLDIALKKRLEELTGKPSVGNFERGKRSIAELMARAEVLEKERNAAAKKQAEIKRNQHLDKVAKEEEKLWARMPHFIEMKTAAGYEEMVKILIDLRDVAKRENRLEAFQEKVNAIAEAYPTRSGLQRRLRDAHLV